MSLSLNQITRRMLLAAAVVAPLAGFAQSSYPNKPIRFIVPFAAGSAPDAIARIVTQHMQGTLGQSIVIDNKPGAQGAIAAVEAARAAPDGYTVFGGNNSTLAANPALYKQLAYNPQRDFVPVGRFITASLTLVVRPDFPAKNLREFIAYARTNKNLSAGYASAGMQVSMAELKGLAGVDFLEASYKGVPQAVTDLMGGQISFTFADNSVASTQIRAGKLRGLGVTSPARTPVMPDLPAIAEELPGFSVIVWSGMSVPTGTPREVVDKLWDAGRKAMASTDVQNKLMALGLEPAPMGPDEFGRFIASETTKWARQIKAAGIQPE